MSETKRWNSLCVCGHEKCEQGETHYFGDSYPLATPCMVEGCNCPKYRPQIDKVEQVTK